MSLCSTQNYKDIARYTPKSLHIWKLLGNFANKIEQMEATKKFEVIYSEEVIEFLNNLPAKAKAKVMFNVTRASYSLDPKFFKKLEGTDIWEFRTLFNSIQYRLLAFWDKDENTMVITTHGFIKKTQKTPQQEIKKANDIRTEYFNSKKGQ